MPSHSELVHLSLSPLCTVNQATVLLSSLTRVTDSHINGVSARLSPPVIRTPQSSQKDLSTQRRPFPVCPYLKWSLWHPHPTGQDDTPSLQYKACSQPFPVLGHTDLHAVVWILDPLPPSFLSGLLVIPHSVYTSGMRSPNFL